VRNGRRRVTGSTTLLLTGLSAVAALLAACTAGERVGPAPQAQPPPPPAACLLDGTELTATTGLTWTPDQNTATDTRCVYDPPGGSTPAGFLAVDVGSTTDDAASQLDTIAELCDSGSRAEVDAADGGFVCRFDGGNVYAVLVRGGQVVTVSTSALPTGTTYAKLAVAMTQQLSAIAAR
jgi:hypothetical protein